MKYVWLYFYMTIHNTIFGCLFVCSFLFFDIFFSLFFGLSLFVTQHICFIIIEWVFECVFLLLHICSILCFKFHACWLCGMKQTDIFSGEYVMLVWLWKFWWILPTYLYISYIYEWFSGDYVDACFSTVHLLIRQQSILIGILNFIHVYNTDFGFGFESMCESFFFVMFMIIYCIYILLAVWLWFYYAFLLIVFCMLSRDILMYIGIWWIGIYMTSLYNMIDAFVLIW